MLVAQHQGNRELEQTLIAFAGTHGREHPNGHLNGHVNGNSNGHFNNQSNGHPNVQPRLRLCEVVASILVQDHARGLAGPGPWQCHAGGVLLVDVLQAMQVS